MALRPEQRVALLGAKLRALVATGWPGQGLVVSKPFMAGAGLVDDSGDIGWLLVDEVRRSVENIDISADDDGPELPRGWLGGAIVWATRAGVRELHVMSEHLTGHDARRANLFTLRPTLWAITGRTLAKVDLAPFFAPVAPSAVVMLFAPTIAEAGADAVVDHGVLRAEVLGLEVAVVMEDDDAVPYLAVGVGRHDRLAQAMMYGTADVATSLRTAVEAVRSYRRGDAGVHPANQLAGERWLREVVYASDPTLKRIEGTEPARLKRSSPAMLVSEAGDLVIGCTTAVDLDAAAFAADARLSIAPTATLRLVMPAASRVPAMDAVCKALLAPAEIEVIDNEWRSLPV